MSLISEDINSGTDSGWIVAVANSVITVSELPSHYDWPHCTVCMYIVALQK